LHIGTSGWVYKHWKGVFYPQGLAQAKWLGHYNQHFDTVELNNTFYRLPSENAFARWRDLSPPGFLYAVKASRLITHLKKLRNAETALDSFVERVRLLGDRLGPVLWQLPPNMKRNEALLDDFLRLLPTDLQHVFEFRNESWFDDAVLDLLRWHNVGFCVYDMPGLTTPVVATSTAVAYLRFHGSASMYDSCYTEAELELWAGRIGRLAEEAADVYVYFNNDTDGFAIANARTLSGYLGVIPYGPPEGSPR